LTDGYRGSVVDWCSAPHRAEAAVANAQPSNDATGAEDGTRTRDKYPDGRGDVRRSLSRRGHDRVDDAGERRPHAPAL